MTARRRRRSRAVDKAVVRDFILLTIGSLGLMVQFVILPLLGHEWHDNEILLVGAEFYAVGLTAFTSGGLFSPEKNAKKEIDEAESRHGQ